MLQSGMMDGDASVKLFVSLFGRSTIMAHTKCLFLLISITALGSLLVSTSYGENSERQALRGSSTRQELPQVDEIQGDRVFTVLPKDAIPAIDNPKFVTGADAGFMNSREPVIGVVFGGQAKAYSVWHLDRHEIVNDRIGDQPIAVTW
jgi:hypothetical protein